MANNDGWWKRLWAWVVRRKSREIKKHHFREFVYLDDISVLSLLVSREGELTEQIQEGFSREESAGSEAGGSIGAKETSISAKSTFQTKSSQSIQATRKANIQSQFRRLHRKVKEANLVFPADVTRKIDTEEKLLQASGASRDVASMTRGSLVELDVRLHADRLFRIGSIITEVADMSEEHPDIFGADSAGLVPGQMKSYGKLLDRFMAGLVPIRSTVTNVRLYENDGKRYVVDAVLAEELGLATKKIELVGVLEKDRFWKDMRRVLFSDATVTVLGRVSVDGIHKKWTPVKLLDLFANTIPGGDTVVSAFEAINFDGIPVEDSDRSEGFKKALEKYVELAVAEADFELSAHHRAQIAQVIEENRSQWASTETQRNAFRSVAELLGQSGLTLNPSRDADLRQAARAHAGIGLFGEIAGTPPRTETTSDDPEANLLEVEVVAMYW